jgi:hypothetical protein
MTLIETLLITINVIYINYYEFNIYRSFIILLNFYRIITLENTNKQLNITIEYLQNTNVEMREINKDLENINIEMKETNKDLENKNKEMKETNNELKFIMKKS